MKSDCTFCQIIRGEKPADFLYRDESLVIFKDIRPSAPVHLLVVPRKHLATLNDITAEDAGLISQMIYRARQMARDQSISESGYRLVFNVERGGGQLIFHLHLHLVGGWK